jgi:hypothetical protein
MESEYAGERSTLHLPQSDRVTVVLSVPGLEREHPGERLALHLHKSDSVAVLLYIPRLERACW